jgi:pilus assembly protein Flp/PilA
MVPETHGCGAEPGYFARLQAKTSDPRRGSMLALWTKITSWMREEKGASMVEYALLVVLIAIVALVAVQIAGTEVSETFSEIASGLEG